MTIELKKQIDGKDFLVIYPLQSSNTQCSQAIFPLFDCPQCVQIHCKMKKITWGNKYKNMKLPKKKKNLWYPELREAMHIYILIKKPTKSSLLNFGAHLNLLYLFLFSFKHPHNLPYYGSVFFLIYQMSMLAYKLKYDSKQNL